VNAEEVQGLMVLAGQIPKPAVVEILLFRLNPTFSGFNPALIRPPSEFDPASIRP
jgi:hypothetical protein